MFDLWHGIGLDTRLGHFSYQGSNENPRSDGQQLWQFCSQGDEKALIYQSIRRWFAFAGWHIPPLTKADLTTKMATFVATISFTTPVLSRNVESKILINLASFWFASTWLDKNHWWVESIPWDHLMCSIFNNQHLGLSFSTSRECDAHVLPFAVSRPATLCLSGGHSPKASDSSAIFLPR